MALKTTIRQHGADLGLKKLDSFGGRLRRPRTDRARQRGQGGDTSGEPFGVGSIQGVLQGAAPALICISSPIGGKSFNTETKILE
jgi:hypothetical protein